MHEHIKPKPRHALPYKGSCHSNENANITWFIKSRGRPYPPGEESDKKNNTQLKNINSMIRYIQRKRRRGMLSYNSGRWRDDEAFKWRQQSQRMIDPHEIKIQNENTLNFKNHNTMKTKFKILKWTLMILLLLAGAGGAWAQGPYPNQGAHVVCLGDVAPYGVINTPGSSYTWSIIPLTGGNGTIAPGNTNLTSVTWNSSGTCNLQVIETNSSGCVGVPVQILVTVTPLNTIALSSAAGTDGQTICINTPLTNITYATTGATGATFSGLPAGVTGNWLANVVTISGTPSVSGIFNYTVTLTGGCGNITANGLITVTPANTITLSSIAGTDGQTVCINTALTNITYATTGATGATFSGLPAGVTGNWLANVVTINGTPTVSGTFNYTVTLTGGCANITSSGSITVTPDNTVTLSSAAGTNGQTLCINTPLTNITYATTGATGATFSGLPAGVSGNWLANVATISGTPTASGTFNYTVTLTGGCGSVTSSGSIIVTPANTVALSSVVGTDGQTLCINTPLTNITYATTGATGATFSGLPAGVTGNFAASVVTISGTPTASGTFNYTVTLTGGCANITATGTITVTPANTITLTSAAATTGQTICINSPITDITYATTGATGATFTGLPAGVTGTWAANVVTISGTPTVAGPFSFTVTLTGGCANITSTGTMTVNPLPVTSPIYHN